MWGRIKVSFGVIGYDPVREKRQWVLVRWSKTKFDAFIAMQGYIHFAVPVKISGEMRRGYRFKHVVYDVGWRIRDFAIFEKLDYLGNN